MYILYQPEQNNQMVYSLQHSRVDPALKTLPAARHVLKLRVSDFAM